MMTLTKDLQERFPQTLVNMLNRQGVELNPVKDIQWHLWRLIPNKDELVDYLELLRAELLDMILLGDCDPVIYYRFHSFRISYRFFENGSTDAFRAIKYALIATTYTLIPKDFTEKNIQSFSIDWDIPQNTFKISATKSLHVITHEYDKNGIIVMCTYTMGDLKRKIQ